MRAEGFSCSLGVLYGGLGIDKLQFLIKTIKIKISSCKVSSILGHQTLDPDPGSGSDIRKNAGSRSVSRSALIHCESATLEPTDFTCLTRENELRLWLFPTQDGGCFCFTATIRRFHVIDVTQPLLLLSLSPVFLI